MRFCNEGGWVVGSDLANALTPDPLDYDVAALPKFGCNRLRCPKCQVMVRSVGGHEFAKGLLPPLPERYDVPDLAAAGYLIPRTYGRQYFCKCTEHLAVQESNALEVPDPDPWTDVIVPWRCDGHEPPRLPHTYDGAEVTPGNIAELVHRSLIEGWAPEAAHERDHRAGVWVARLHVRLGQTVHQPAVESAALQVVEHDSVEARSRAIQALKMIGSAGLVDRSLAILSGGRSGWTGVADPFTLTSGETLVETLWRIVTPLVAVPGPARDMAMEDAITPGRGSYALFLALTKGYPDWAARNVQRMVQATPDQRTALEKACKFTLPRNGLRQRALADLASIP